MQAITIVKKAWNCVRGTNQEVAYVTIYDPLVLRWPEGYHRKIWRRWHNRNTNILCHLYERSHDRQRAWRLNDLRLARELDAARQKKT